MTRTDGFSMRSTSRTSLLAFLDETGGADLQKIDPQFPVFVAATVVCTPRKYWDEVVPAVDAFRETHCGGRVILHSREIRRQEGDFAFLVDRVQRAAFYSGLNTLMKALPAGFLAAAVHTQQHLARYGPNAFHPYHWAMALTLERLLYCANQHRVDRVHLIAESRTQTLDDELRAAFDHVLAHGTQYVASRKFATIDWELTFRMKRQDVIGTQIADLVGYPVARHVIDPVQSHPTMPVLRPKFLADATGKIVGLKIVP